MYSYTTKTAVQREVVMKIRKTVAIILAVASLGGTHLAWADEEVATAENSGTVQDTSAYTDKEVAPAIAVDSGNDAVSKPEYATRQDLDALKDLIDEADKKKWNSGWTVNVTGAIAGGYTSSNFGASGNGTAKDGFAIQYVTLGLGGNLREDPVDDFDVRYKTSLIWAGQGKDVGATNSGTANSSNTQLQTPALADAYISVDLHTAKKTLEPAWIGSVTLGQTLLPFGQENLSLEDQRPTIRTAQYVANYGIGRDIGIKHDGGIINRYDPASGVTTPLIGYTLGLWNGTGANRLDNNNQKALNARVLITPVAEYLSLFSGLTFGGSYYKDIVGGSSTTAARKVGKEWYGLELSWLRKPFLLTAESIYGNNPNLPASVNPANPVIPNSTVVGRQKSSDVIVTLFWSPNTLPDFQPLYRYDRYTSNNTTTAIHSIGFNYFVWQTTPVLYRTFQAKDTARVLKIQANWNIREQLPTQKATANDYSLLLVASF